MSTCDVKIRVPIDLKAWIVHRAEVNCRSTNGEILAIMKSIMLAEQMGDQKVAQ